MTMHPWVVRSSALYFFLKDFFVLFSACLIVERLFFLYALFVLCVHGYYSIKLGMVLFSCGVLALRSGLYT